MTWLSRRGVGIRAIQAQADWTRSHRPHATDRPRRCQVCGAPTLITPDGHELDDRPRYRGLMHQCKVA